MEKLPEKKIGMMRKFGCNLKKGILKNVVWITLQDRQFKLKNVKIPKVKKDGTDLNSIFYAYTKHREKFLKLKT